MSDFEVVALGVGDTFSEKHHTTALLLICDGFHLAIDCPDTYRSVLRAASQASGRALQIADIDHVLITHVHGDHMNGLEGFTFFKQFVEGKRVKLIASPDVRAVIWDERLKAPMATLWNGAAFQAMGFDTYFEHVALDWTSTITVGPFRITARRTIHHVPTSALLVEAAGRTLGYSADTAFDAGLIEFLSPADLIIHETNYGPAHTPYAALAALPAELRARMRLVHYADTFDTAASVIATLREGDILRP
ncbi:MAG TPA: MBL fold metallo-hydrolase [Polyangia bacterium]|jgi:ribonuclease BN (tRNA processing enzyme)|nr:MBL fold metallo-hydrolase [Polyangia bacterium]